MLQYAIIDDYAHMRLRHAMRYSLWSHHGAVEAGPAQLLVGGRQLPLGLSIGVHGVAERYEPQSRGRRMTGGRAAPARPVVVQLGRTAFRGTQGTAANPLAATAR